MNVPLRLFVCSYHATNPLNKVAVDAHFRCGRDGGSLCLEVLLVVVVV